MNTYADKTSENKSQAVANNLPKRQSDSESTFRFIDNRPEAITQRKLQEAINNSPHVQQLKAYQEKGMANNSQRATQLRVYQAMADQYSSPTAQRKEKLERETLQGKFEPIQKKENKTGLPDNLKSGIENLSGYSVDDVKVHYNSGKPAQLNAHAFAQGTDIHLGSGQEKHLAHEAWHVVQQKQGRVPPTTHVKGVAVNDNISLEQEANHMGAKALQMKKNETSHLRVGGKANITQYKVMQFVAPIQLQDMRQYYNMIQNRIPANWATRLAILEDVPILAAQAMQWRVNKNGADNLWNHWSNLYNILQGDGAVINAPTVGAMTAALQQMITYQIAFTAVHGLLIDHGIWDVKDQLAHAHYINAGANIAGVDGAFYQANDDETLDQYKIRLRTTVRVYVRPGQAAWLAAANYGADPVVRNRANFGAFASHWTLYRNNLGDLNALRVDNPGVAIANAMVPIGIGPFGVHVSLEVPGVGEDKPRIFGRPPAMGRTYNGVNLPAVATFLAMGVELDTQNAIEVAQVQAWATARTNRIRAGWEAH